MRNIFITAFSLIIIIQTIQAQDSSGKKQEDYLKSLMDNKPAKEYVEAVFKAPRIIMSHSVEMVKPGVLSFLIMHRFGNVNLGAYEFFGLDRATLRLGFDYGINKDLTVGIGRGDFKKEFDGFLKYRALHQSTGERSIPFSLILVAGSTVQSLKINNDKRDFSDRLSFYGQAMIGRKFNESLSLQVGPTIVHRY